MADAPSNFIRNNPTARTVGLILTVTGVIIIVVLAILQITAGDEEDPVAATTVATTTTTTEPATTTTEPATTTTEAATTTTTEPATTTTEPATTTTEGTTTTTSEGTTTTTTTEPEVEPTPDEEVADFVENIFVVALSEGDTDTLVDHLHPVVIARFGQEVCQNFVEDTILLIEAYVVTGDVEVGMDEFEVDGETVVVDPTYTVPVEFVFLGDSIDDNATFAPIEDPEAGDPDDPTKMTWFTACA